MTHELSLDSKLLPYFTNPEYWDGRMVRSGQEPDLAQKDLNCSPRQIKQARRDLEASLESMHSYYPEKTFNKGTVFNPHEWPIGTTYMFGSEWLRHGGKASAFTLTSGELLQRPTDLAPDLTFTSVADYGVCDASIDTTYGYTTGWGIVAPTEKPDRHRRCSTWTQKILRNPRNQKITIGSKDIAGRESSLDIGRTYLFEPQEDGSQMMMRTNILAVCINNVPPRKRRQFFVANPIGKLALAGSQ